MSDTLANREPSGAERMFADFAPGLPPKERSLITAGALTTLGNADDELMEAISHLAFFTGWPKAMAATTVAERVLRSDTT